MRLEGTEPYERSKAYWTSRISTLPPAPELPLEEVSGDAGSAGLRAPYAPDRGLALGADQGTGDHGRSDPLDDCPERLCPGVGALEQELSVRPQRDGQQTSPDPSRGRCAGRRLHDDRAARRVDLREPRGLLELASALQDRLWQDLEHPHFGGVEVLRELARTRGDGVLTAPIVFTSGLGFELDAMDKVTYAVSQTPQVLMDHQSMEVAGDLMLTWDSIDDAFPERMLDEMFSAYRGYMEAIADDEGLWDGTGDLGRYLPDGSIESLGPEDALLKIGSYHIALGAIEAHLGTHPQVREAAVVALETAGDRPRLVACVVAEDEPDVASDEPAPTVGDGAVSGAGAASDVHAAMHDAGEGMVDPLERLEFKLRRHGLRRFENAASVDLLSARDTEDRALLHRSRRSHRLFDPESVSPEALGALLEALRSSTDDSGIPKHWYGSAGASYSVQAYVGIAQNKVSGIPGGTYYYDPDAHALRAIAPGVSLGADVHASTNESLVVQSAFTIVLVAERNAIEPLYGARAERFSLIEAGLIAQLLEMEAGRCGIGLCQVSLDDTATLRQALELSDGHVVLHGLVGGRSGSPGSLNGKAPAMDHAALWGELRELLAEKLPRDMAAAQFVAVSQLPLTADGKLDRGALSELVSASPGAGAADGSSESPEISDLATAGALSLRLAATPVKDHAAVALEIVHDALTAVLGEDAVPAIEPDRPFMELGLDSLQAVRLRNRLEETSGLRLPATLVFDRPTPRLVAERVLELAVAADGEGTVSAEDELAQLEQRLRALASVELGRATVASRLRALVGALDPQGQDEANSDLAEATGESILELIDKELGGA